MERAIPAGKYKIIKFKKGYEFYPDGILFSKGIKFVAEKKKDGTFLLHDSGSIMKALLEDAMDAVDVVKELRLGSSSNGFRFRDGRVYIKVREEELPVAVRRLERFATEVYHKATVGLGG